MWFWTRDTKNLTYYLVQGVPYTTGILKNSNSNIITIFVSSMLKDLLFKKLRLVNLPQIVLKGRNKVFTLTVIFGLGEKVINRKML